MFKHLWFFVAVILLLSSCSTSDSSKDLSGNDAGNTPGDETAVPEIKTPYDFANGCYSLKSVSSGNYVLSTPLTYRASADDAGKAEAFYMKPSALGEYLLSDRQGSYLSSFGDSAIMRTKILSNSAKWQLTSLGENRFAFKSITSLNYLAVTQGNMLIQTQDAGLTSHFELQAAQGCTPFPEAELNVEIADYSGQPVNPDMAMARPAVGEPIIGFADVHVHLNHFLSSGQTTFVGETFNPLGISEALKDCSHLHGKDGSTDILGMVQDNITSHNTTGWPDFTWWPTSYSQTHQQAYYKWIERAWLSGQRLMVQQMVSAEILGIVKNSLIKPKIDVPAQDDMSICDMQIKNMYDMQDYIDAQCGGPGKGWFRICKSSRQAREAISEGKMAVILAIEVDTVFGGDRDYISDYENGKITKRELDAKLNSIKYQIDKYYDLGVRTVFPIHGINNGYGGAWLYVNVVWNLGNKLMRGDFYEVEESPNPRVTYHESGIGYTNEEWINLLRNLGIDLPYVPKDAKGHSNKQGLTKLGEWLIKELIKKGIVIEIDHMSNRTVNKALDIIWDYKYPGVVATHGRITDLYPPDANTYEQLDIPHMIKVIQLGGLFSAHPDWALKGDNFCYADYLRFMIELSKSGPGQGILYNEDYFYYSRDKNGNYIPYKVPTSWYNTNNDPTDDLVLGMPLTTDVNGACSLPKPELIKNPIPLDYDKAGIGALYPGLYNEDIVDASKVRFYRQKTGNRTFDVNKDGMAHYGLMPDYIRLRQLQDPNLTLNAFFSGAESYLRMLERVERYHADPDNYPSRDPEHWITVDTEYWHDDYWK